MYEMLGWHVDGRPLSYLTSKHRFCLGLGAAPIPTDEVVKYAETDQIKWCSDGHKELAYEWMSGAGPNNPFALRAAKKRLKQTMQATEIASAEAPHLPDSATAQLRLIHENLASKRTSSVKEYKRTCRKCGASWFVPKELAEEKAPPDGKIKGARLATLGTGAMWGIARHAQTQVASFEAQKQRVFDNGRCRNCGSSDYVQTKAW